MWLILFPALGDLYTEAAEAAMEAMKGRLANQYYQKAEEAWAMMEEWHCNYAVLVYRLFLKT